VRIVIVSPHRDDAAFALALAVGTWIEAGHKVSVLNCFSRSEEVRFSDADSVHANDRMSFVTALRGREDEVWRRQYGSALTLVDLNMKDAPLRLHCPMDEVYGLTVNPNDKALTKIQKAIERVGPGAVVFPLGLGAHIDHLTARQAAIGIAGTAVRCAFYEDMPFALGLEAIDEQVREFAREWNVPLTPVFAGEPVDEATAVARKRRAILCYDSQVDDAEVKQMAESCKVYEGRERLWANAAWVESSLPWNA
jgi:LmbE family N-acetylglucosaminyl deacetylase